MVQKSAAEVRQSAEQKYWTIETFNDANQQDKRSIATLSESSHTYQNMFKQFSDKFQAFNKKLSEKAEIT